MKNIKVNIINFDGNPSSTTLNFAICEQLYFKTGSYEERKEAFSKGMEDQRKAIAACAQSYVNNAVSKIENYSTHGTSQYAIESRMILDLIDGRV